MAIRIAPAMADDDETGSAAVINKDLPQIVPLGRPVASPLILGRCSDEVALSDFNAYRTQNCEGSCRVEIEIRQRKIQ
jgi:hypothetical protein